MAGRSARRTRHRGRIEELPSGSLRVSVYAGLDPLTKRRTYIRETIASGPKAPTQAEKTLTRLLNQVDEKRQPRTSATVNQLLDKFLELHALEGSTRRGYEGYIRKHIKPLLGSLKVKQVDAEVLESFYTELRRCREHCDGRQHTQHRTQLQHQCDPHPDAPCRPADPSCRHCRRTCTRHVCRPLAKSSVRQAHWILAGAFGDAVRWGWVAIDPTDRARHPDRERPKPRPPAVEDAARLIDEAARRDPDWGAFVWVITTTGARRGELCALRWRDIDLDNSVVHLHRAISLNEAREWFEKDTKTHQDRRVVLDEGTVEVLREHRLRARERAEALGVELPSSAYVFSLEPGGSRSLLPDSVTQRYDRMAERLGIETTLHKLRHYSATELINAGVQIGAVAGRLGHGGGGATTLQVYAAWLSEADQRAATQLAGRMPDRRRAANGEPGAAEAHTSQAAEPAGPYAKIAADLHGAIRSGILASGDRLPTVKDLCARYEVAASTAHRAVQLLKEEGLVAASRGRRATVL